LAIFQALLFEHGFDPARYDSDSDSGSEDENENGDDHPATGDDPDDTFSDMNLPPGKLDFEIDENTARAERRRRERERRREKERLRDWEEEVEEVSHSIGLFALVSSPIRLVSS
jgi:hypothetical protein